MICLTPSSPCSKPVRISVLFVCTGNTCRSPMAEALCKKMLEEGSKNRTCKFEVGSAGTHALPGQSASIRTIEAAQTLTIDLSQHRSRLLTQTLIQRSTVIFGMTQEHVAYIKESFQHLPQHLYLLGEWCDKGEVLDPIGGDEATYQQMLKQMQALMPSVLAFLQSIPC